MIERPEVQVALTIAALLLVGGGGIGFIVGRVTKHAPPAAPSGFTEQEMEAERKAAFAEGHLCGHNDAVEAERIKRSEAGIKAAATRKANAEAALVPQDGDDVVTDLGTWEQDWPARDAIEEVAP